MTKIVTSAVFLGTAKTSMVAMAMTGTVSKVAKRFKIGRRQDGRNATFWKRKSLSPQQGQTRNWETRSFSPKKWTKVKNVEMCTCAYVIPWLLVQWQPLQKNSILLTHYVRWAQYANVQYACKFVLNSQVEWFMNI